MKASQDKKLLKQAEAVEAWAQYENDQKATQNNMLRLRAERLARDALPPEAHTLPESQGEKKKKPKRPGKSSKQQNVGDRP